MKVAIPTALIFAILLITAIASAQFVPQQGSNPYSNPYSASQILPVPAYNSSYNPMYMPNSMSNPYATNPFAQPSYNFNLPQYNYTLPAYDYSPPSYSNPYSSPYDDSSSSLSAEDQEEKRERDEERKEEREERQEEKRREREERKREERLERDRARRGEKPSSNEGAEEQSGEKSEVNNWPPVPKSSARAAEVAPPAPAKSVGAAESKPTAAPRVAAVAAPAPAKVDSWWERDPAYQQYLKDKKNYETAQRAKPDWPPKPKPVTTIPAPQKQIESSTGLLAASAEGCVDCGPKKGPLTQQIEQLQEAADTRQVFIMTRPPDSKLSEGVRTVINTIYQNCEAYSTIIRPDYCQEGFIGKSFCAKSHPRAAGDLTAFKNEQEFFSYATASQPGSNVMTPERPQGPQCRDMNKTPPVFRVDTDGKGVGRPKITKSANGKVNLNLFNEEKTGGKFVTLDCSGFVSAALSAAGLNAAPNSPTLQVTTATLRSGAASCLGTVTFNPSESIKSGDVAVFSGESQHSMIFDKVGADPFGLKNIPPAPAGTSVQEHCLAKLKLSDFDFVIAQSGLYGGRIAASQARAVDYITNFGKGYMDGINLQIVQMAQDACVSKLTGVTKKADRPSGAKLLRHKGSSAPGCVRSTPTEVVGRPCVGSCT